MLLKGTTTIGTIADNVPIGTSGKGSYVWPGWTGKVPGSDYKVSVQSISQPTIKDISNNFFTVTAGTTTPSITVTSPNGGESWDRSVSQTLTWSYTGNPGSTVKIVLLKGTTTIGTIADNVPIGTSGKGSYVWPSWTGKVPGSDYKVSVQSISQPTISDISNNFFTVTAGTTYSLNHRHFTQRWGVMGPQRISNAHLELHGQSRVNSKNCAPERNYHNRYHRR